VIPEKMVTKISRQVIPDGTVLYVYVYKLILHGIQFGETEKHKKPQFFFRQKSLGNL